MATLFVRHTVADYAAWRRIFDDFAPTHEALGVIDKAVYQAADNANDITVTHDFATLDAAKAFAGSPQLKAAMDHAGVTSAPTIWFTTRA
ncbi:MAG: cyclase [Chloroflexi bacterium]|nr:cyclase [Chloroflexota bacterium]